MKKLTFFLLLTFVLLISCNNENSPQEEYFLSENAVIEENIKEVHDEYSILVRDKIIEWNRSNELNKDKIREMWDIIIMNLSNTMAISSDEVIKMYNSLDINEDNWTNIYPEKFKLLPKEYQDFLVELEQTFLNNTSKTDDELMALFESKKEIWNHKISPEIVFNTIEVAKSSFIFWRENFEFVNINNNSLSSRATCWNAIGSLSLGDLTGAAWGSLGGPGGSLLGAVGGTLGATVQGAVFGFDCP